MNFHRHITIIHESMNRRVQKGSRIKFIQSQQWKQKMLKTLNKLARHQIYDQFLIEDMIAIVEAIPQYSFIQAIINIQPFKPNVSKTNKTYSLKKGISNYKNHTVYSSRSQNKSYEEPRQGWMSNIFKLKNSVHNRIKDSVYFIQDVHAKNTILQSTLALITEKQALIKQFQAPYHPYRRIIDQFVFILEHKYKNYISVRPNPNIESLQQMIILDVNLLQEFIIRSSGPYLLIFKTKNKQQRIEFQIQIMTFIKKYLERHTQINVLMQKIIKFALKNSPNLQESLQMIPCHIQIDQFNLQNYFKINGQYFYAIKSLIQFSQSQSAWISLRKLQQLKDNILKDIFIYYQNQSNPNPPEENRQYKQHNDRSLNLSVENQLQIIKYLLCKAKIFIIDVLTRLKYLQTIYGEEEISYKYDGSSFMHAQLMVAIEFILLQHA